MLYVITNRLSVKTFNETQGFCTMSPGCSEKGERDLGMRLEHSLKQTASSTVSFMHT